MAPSPHFPKAVSVYMESTPNPHTLKFVVNKILIPEGMSFDFPGVTSTLHAPLARELFTYAFVVRVFYRDNFITITKKEHIDRVVVQDTLRTHIKNFIAGGNRIIEPALLVRDNRKEDSMVVQKIKAAFDEYINPAVQQDGGSIVFHSYANGIIKVSLHGACRGCPASAHTLKAGVENLLKKMMPDEVIAVEEFT